jgi:2-polyprenyl-3-methyl-5-hydroxy-6-metoxy-1,4-benzoquinol methylase
MNRLKKEIVESLDASLELYPYLSELLYDLKELGSSTQDVLSAVKGLPLGGEVLGLDLGCGKGALALALASELGYNVIGIDAFEPFVLEAKQSGRKLGVADLCSFYCLDFRGQIKKRQLFDVVFFLAVGPVLGNLEETVCKVRNVVRPGGYIIIDDAFLADNITPAKELEPYVDHQGAIAQLTSCGDVLVREIIPSLSKIKQTNSRNTAMIQKRAALLSKKHPELKKLFEGYVAVQEKESSLMETTFIPALWVLQKNAPI